jgi:osmotically-inducible protein OsmY
MITKLLILLLGIALGVAGWHFYQRTFHPSVAQRAGDLAGRTREAAAETKQQTAASARAIGENLGDAGIVALIKGKYLLDKDLSALAISVECTDGKVTLTGTAESAERIARAVEIARQTKGVADVTSRLTVKN